MPHRAKPYTTTTMAADTSTHITPRSPDIELVAEMSGHSGCRVLLYRSGASHFVRKISASTAYNERLAHQRDKQRDIAQLINTPAVLSWGEIDGLSYFDMDYVRGHDFKTYVPLQNVTHLCELGHRILAPLQAFARTVSGQVPEESFRTKIDSVRGAIQLGQLYHNYETVLDPILELLAKSDWSRIPASKCHGDFTLENLIITEGPDLVMIDVLDGDLSTFWLDAAKLLQDLGSGWSLRSLLWKPKTSSSERLLGMLNRYLYDEIGAQIDAMFPDMARKLTQMRALQAARVLPYVKSEHDYWHVVQGLNQLFQREA